MCDVCVSYKTKIGEQLVLRTREETNRIISFVQTAETFHRAFLHDVTTAILVLQTNPVKIELVFYVKVFSFLFQ